MLCMATGTHERAKLACCAARWNHMMVVFRMVKHTAGTDNNASAERGALLATSLSHLIVIST